MQNAESRIIISLVGEQPVLSLLPIRYLQPTEVALIYTNTSKSVGQNLKPLLKNNSRVIDCEVTPYNILKIKSSLTKLVEANNWNARNLIFNLTGGTKPMSLAAFQFAYELKSSVAYLQSEGGQSLLYLYGWKGELLDLVKRDEIGSLLKINDFLQIYGRNDYFKKINNNQHQSGEIFENAMGSALIEICDEVKQGISFQAFPHVELDFIFRVGNQFGIGEAKSGIDPGKKSSIDQLNSTTHREFLGTYTKKFLFLQGSISSNNQKLSDAYRINVWKTNKSLENGKLSSSDFEFLKETVIKRLKS